MSLQKGDFSVKMGLCKSCAAFFCVTPFIPFSKKTPTAKTPSSFICLFTYLGYLFVVPLASDFLSNCPTHELCVYTKTRWCCERQRVSITSLTLSKDVFCGKALLQLSGITGDAGARGAGDAEPWLGWKWKWWNFPKKIALPCFGGCLDVLCAGILLRQSTAFPWVASPIYSHMPQLFPTLSGRNFIWKHKSRGKLTLQPSSLTCSHRVGGEWCRDRPQCKIWGCFLSSTQGCFYPHPLEKYLLIKSCQDCAVSLVYLLEMWLVPHQNMSKKSAEENNTRSRWCELHCQVSKYRAGSWFKLLFLGDVTRGMPWFAIRSFRFHTELPSTSSSTSCSSSPRL